MHRVCKRPKTLFPSSPRPSASFGTTTLLPSGGRQKKGILAPFYIRPTVVYEGEIEYQTTRINIGFYALNSLGRNVNVRIMFHGASCPPSIFLFSPRPSQHRSLVAAVITAITRWGHVPACLRLRKCRGVAHAQAAENVGLSDTNRLRADRHIRGIVNVYLKQANTYKSSS